MIYLAKAKHPQGDQYRLVDAQNDKKAMDITIKYFGPNYEIEILPMLSKDTKEKYWLNNVKNYKS